MTNARFDGHYFFLGRDYPNTVQTYSIRIIYFQRHPTTGCRVNFPHSRLEVSDMKRLQKWFDQIAGISADEMARLARAREIFDTPGVDVASLGKPACWRRKARVQSASV